MSITATARSGAAAISGVSRQRDYHWTALLILLGILACAIAASFYADGPVLDPSLLGP